MDLEEGRDRLVDCHTQTVDCLRFGWGYFIVAVAFGEGFIHACTSSNRPACIRVSSLDPSILRISERHSNENSVAREVANRAIHSLIVVLELVQSAGDKIP